jgi:monofunctional biosynthetic peptidoglycan transglycosylase
MRFDLLSIAQSIEALRIRVPSSTAMMRFRESAEGLPQGTYRSTWFDFVDISPMLWWSVVCAEDPYFFEHKGVYWPAIRLALKGLIRQRRVVAGGSTISQQLTKNLFLTPERSVRRKLREALITFWMERQLCKNRILEIYLNQVEWGMGIWGCDAACKYYLDKNPSEVTAFEGAFLASLLPAPRQGCAPSRLAWLARKQIRILTRMCAGGLIDDKMWLKGCAASVVLNRYLREGAELTPIVRYVAAHPPIEPSWAQPYLTGASELLVRLRRNDRMPEDPKY